MKTDSEYQSKICPYLIFRVRYTGILKNIDFYGYLLENSKHFANFTKIPHKFGEFLNILEFSKIFWEFSSIF